MFAPVWHTLGNHSNAAIRRPVVRTFALRIDWVDARRSRPNYNQFVLHAMRDT